MDFNFPLDISALINFRCKDVPGVAHRDTEEWLADLRHMSVCVSLFLCVCAQGHNGGICAHAAFLFNAALGYKSSSLSNNI